MNPKDIEKATKELKDSIDENATSAPHLSVDPKTEKPSVVGDPNEIPVGLGNYSLVFYYPPEDISEEDKKSMVLDKETGYYKAQVNYTKKRVKPLYRGKVVVMLTEIFSYAKVIRGDGYTSDLDDYALGAAVLDQIDKVAKLAQVVLGIPDSQLEYLPPNQLIKFLNQLHQNEPNILKESSNFLS